MFIKILRFMDDIICTIPIYNKKHYIKLYIYVYIIHNREKLNSINIFGLCPKHYFSTIMSCGEISLEQEISRVKLILKTNCIDRE